MKVDEIISFSGENLPTKLVNSHLLLQVFYLALHQGCNSHNKECCSSNSIDQ